jgi:AcrR family transcriptional regulator
MSAPQGQLGHEADLFVEVTPDAARRLLLAALQSFADVGFHAATTREIAGRAGLSPAAVYIHFSSKTELLYRIIQLGHEHALRTLEEALDAYTDPADRVRSGVSAFVEWHAHNYRLARVAQYELPALPRESADQIFAIRRRFEARMQAELRVGLEAGDFDIKDVDGATTGILSLCIDLVRWYSPRIRRSPEEIAELYSDLALRMIASPALHNVMLEAAT